jgi:hypothetical protein
VAGTTNDDMTESEGGPAGSLEVASTSAVSRWNQQLVQVLTVVGFGLPLGSYVWLVGHFSVNVPVGDDWDDVTVIQSSYVHYFDWGQLWTQHNENRIFFPNLIVVLVAHTLHYDIRVLEYLGAIMLIAATALVLIAHKRRSPTTPWLYYCPVAFMAFSFVQQDNALWGFQMAWFVVLVTLAAVLLLLDREILTWPVLVVAIAVAVVGSFSSLQGLLIWPAGLVLFFYRRRTWTQAGVWIVVAIATSVIYFRNYDAAASPLPRFALQHPLFAVKFFFFLIGDVLGKPVTLGSANSGNTLVILFGIFIVALALGTVLICGIRRDEHTGSPIGIALICYGLMFALIVTQGRSFYGLGGASSSRYTTFDLLILVGTYLALLGRRPLWRVDTQAEEVASMSHQASPRLSVGRGLPGIRRVAYRTAVILVATAVTLQVLLGFHNGLNAARSFHDSQVKAVKALRNIDHLSNQELAQAEFFVSPSVIRRQTRVLKAHHLSVFGH